MIVGGQRIEERGMEMISKRAAPICWHGNVNNVCSGSSSLLNATLTLWSRRQDNHIRRMIICYRWAEKI